MTKASWIRLVVVLGVVGSLEVACRAQIIKPITMIPPSEMLVALVALLRSGALSADIAQTLGNVLLAFACAVGGGFALGVALHAAPRLRNVVAPFLASYYAVPFFVFYPVLIVVFGMNDLPIVVIGFLFAVVAMIIATLNGLDRVPRALIKTAQIHRLGALRTALLVKLPSATPQIFTGVKLAVAYSFIGVIAAEFILASAGLGYAISYAYNNFDNRTMYALMLFIIVLVTTINMTFHYWEGALRRRRERA